MTQTLYAHKNKIKFKKNVWTDYPFLNHIGMPRIQGISYHTTWCNTVVSVTLETEVGESFELMNLRLAWAIQ
jgi:tetrahydromethanopterin S-methyltransferase subunit E